MVKNLKRALLGALVSCCCSATADDWPQWMGPQRDGVWREDGIVSRFPAEGPRVIWRSPVSNGYTGPAVAGDRLFLMDRIIKAGETNAENPFARSDVSGYERVLCFDARSGEKLWQHEYECRYTISYPAGPRATPLVDGARVYTLGAEGALRCLDTASGAVIWSKELKTDYKVKAPMWGFTGHPLVDGDRLICLVAGQGSTVVAFDKKTGAEIWKSLSAAEPGYSAPVIYEHAGERLLIVFHPEAANALDPVTGRVGWSVPFKSYAGLSVAMPRKLDDLLFFTSFYNGSLMVKLRAPDGAPEVLWRTEKQDERKTTHLNAIIPTPFVEDGHIYGICSYGQLRCLDATTGVRKWETYKATTEGEPVRWANAFLVKHRDRFFLFNEKGELIIARLSPSGYEEIDRARILEPTNRDPGRAVVWSHPAFAHRRIYARNDKELVCADLAAAGDATR